LTAIVRVAAVARFVNATLRAGDRIG